MEASLALVTLAKRGEFPELREIVGASHGDDASKAQLLYTLLRIAEDHGHAAPLAWATVESEARRHDPDGVLPAMTALELAVTYLRGEFGLDDPSLARPHLTYLATVTRAGDLAEEFADYLLGCLAELRDELTGKAAAVYDAVFPSRAVS